MTPVKTVIFWLTILAVFSDRLMITVGVNLYLYEVVMLVNLAILAVYGWLWVPPKIVAMFGYLAGTVVLGFVLHTEGVSGFAKEVIGIIPSAIFFPSFLRMMKFDVKRCFRAYAEVAFYVAGFGILYLPFQTGLTGRLTSVMLEPASFCVVCVPALYYFADRWHREGRKYALRFLVMLAAVLLTVSSQGFMGILFGIVLFGLRFRRMRLFVPAVVLVLGMLLYAVSSDFQLRLDDSVSALSSGDLERVNQSTFGVMVNYFIVEKQFAEHPLVGGGLGSHEGTYDKFFEEIPGVYGSFEFLRGLGRSEANSLLLRVISEFGLVGLCLCIWFVWHYWPRGGDDEQRAIACALLCYLLLKILRSGAYFSAEEVLFITIYAVNGMPQRLAAKARTVPCGGALLPSSASLPVSSL